MKINQAKRNDAELLIQKLCEKFDFEKVSKILLKDLNEEDWISALHDVDPQQVREVVEKLDKEAKSLDVAKIDIVTSYLTSPRQTSKEDLSPSEILLGDIKKNREDSNENNSTEEVTAHHSHIMPTEEDNMQDLTDREIDGHSNSDKEMRKAFVLT